ncbi:MAG TPA: DUF1080 domain-containing protein [Candidatus Paceibacterota bacterium]|nr:DUF1080 domain-containing protein [Candidatus Paceibacterota bacterium]
MMNRISRKLSMLAGQAVLAGCAMVWVAPWVWAGQPDPDAEGWIPLFDGRTTQGWRGFNRTDFPQKGWTVEDGCLKHLRSGGGGDIVTTAQFTDFEFEWEWRLGPGANGGVKYMISEKRGRAIGHEYQMLDDAAALAKRPPGKGSTASLYDLIPPTRPPLRPAGQFNQSRIVVRGLEVEHWLNGEKVVSYTLASPQLKQAIAQSKFKDVAGFGDKVKGPILLQDHGGEVWFRNIRIREIPSR